MIGDLMVTFGLCAACHQVRSDQPWTLSASFGDIQIFTTAADDNWSGFPLVESEDEHWRVWLLGELYEAVSTLTEAIQHPEKLNGHFLLVAYEKGQNRVHVITNRLGTVHCYHASNGAGAGLGTFSPAVAQAAALSELDIQAVAEFLHFGFFLGGSTYWQNVAVLPAANRTVFEKNGRIISQVPYWHWHYEPSASLTSDDAIDRFHELFRNVLTGQVKQKSVALPLSGGLDSRCTLAELGEAGFGGAASVFPFSYGYFDDSAETRIARQLGEKRDMAVKIWTIQPYLFDQIERIIAVVEGFQDITQCRQAYVVDELAQQADYVVAAHWGDVWLDDMGFLGQEVPADEAIADVIIEKYSRKGSEKLIALFKGSLPADWKRTMKQHVQTSLGAFGNIDDLDFKIKAWKTAEWSHRWTLSSLRMYQGGVFPLLPFYDNRLVDFFLQVPGEFVVGRRLQIDYLKRFAPDLAKVTWQMFDANLYNYKGFNTWLLPRRALQKLNRTLSKQSVIQRNWEVQFLNPAGLAGLKRYLLKPGLGLHDLVSAADVEQLVKDITRKPSAELGYTLSMLVTLSAWLEKYD